MSGPQFGLPAPVALTDLEAAFIQEEPPGLFPPNQDSNWGWHRKMFTDQLTVIESQQQLIFNEKWPMTANQFLTYHEFMMGIPVNPPYTLNQRRALVEIQWLRGPFSITLIQTILNFFVSIVLSPYPAPAFGPGGISIGSGIPLYSGLYGNPENYYIIRTSPGTYSYQVLYDNSLGIDSVGITRELTRITPAGISFTLSTYTGLHKTGGGRITHLLTGGAMSKTTFRKTGGGRVHLFTGGPGI